MERFRTLNDSMKATIIVCLFTLLMSIGGAYGVLKIDDTKMKAQIESLECRFTDRLTYITDTIRDHQAAVTTFQSQVEKMTTVYANRTEISMDRLDQTMSKFADKVENLSNSIARLDERLKPIEARRNLKDGS